MTTTPQRYYTIVDLMMTGTRLLHLTSIAVLPHEGVFTARPVNRFEAGLLIDFFVAQKRAVLHVTKPDCLRMLREISAVDFPSLRRADRIPIRLDNDDAILCSSLNLLGKQKWANGHGDLLGPDDYEFLLITHTKLTENEPC